MEVNLFFAICFVILNILDITTTRKIIARGGCEASPLPWLLMKVNLFLPVKLIVTLALAAFIVVSKNVYDGIFLCGIISLFVLNNYYQLYMDDKESKINP